MAANPVPYVPDLNFDITAGPSETTVRCTGRIVAGTTAFLKNAVKPLLAPNHTVVLDLTDVDYMDSAGLGAIVSLYVTAKGSKSHLRLINLNRRLRELFSITRLGEVMAEGRDPEYYGIP